MKKQAWIGFVIVLIGVGFWASQLLNKKESSKEVTTISQEPDSSYWTCPMHPQIHSGKSGECPICHMKLVQVKAQGSHTGHVQENESRATVVATPAQMKLLGAQKVTVEKMDLISRIPISGHLTSPSSVAFQVYEADLRYIKTGLTFTGKSSFISDVQIDGTITSIDTIVDPTSRTVRVLGQIKKGPHGLIPETTFSGEIEIMLKGVTAIPESSVLHTGSEDLVYLVQEDGSLTAQPAKLGQKTESYYEVVDGLSPGQSISSGPNFLIDSEAKIRGISENARDSGKSSITACPNDQHWDIPMAMCMPGKTK